MKTNEVVKQLAHVFKTRLTEMQRNRLRYHIEQGTPIFCGPNAMTRWIADDGSA